MFLLATDAAIAIAAASAAAAVGSFFAYLHFGSRSEAHAARDEALALAETRGEVIADLRGRLRAIERQLSEATVAYQDRVRELEGALGQSESEAREHAFQMQRFYAASLAGLLRDVRADLEESPPNVDRTLARVRELLAKEQPAA